MRTLQPLTLNKVSATHKLLNARHRNYRTFGFMVRKIRQNKGITLGEFCRRTHLNPSNWSKVERGILPPPYPEDHFDLIGSALELASYDRLWETLRDIAYICRGEIPPELSRRMESVRRLRVLFAELRQSMRSDVEKKFIEQNRKIRERPLF